MQLKSIGLIVVDSSIKFQLAWVGKLKAKQMITLIEKFKPVFARLLIEPSIHVSKEGIAHYKITKRVAGKENIHENYIGYIKEYYDDFKEIEKTLDDLEDEVIRFEAVQEVANASLQ